MRNNSLHPVKVVIAPDSYKGSLSSIEVANAIEKGILNTGLCLEIIKVPMADGGEGTVEAMIHATGGQLRTATVTGPLGEQIPSFFGVLGDGKTAIIEMAAASGLPLVPVNRRNPMITTTYGTGQLIRLALDEGCRKIIIGIGGSATNDGGMGMAQALGIVFYDKEGAKLGWGGQELEKVVNIDRSGIDPRISETDFVVMCDVRNPLCGSNGAAAIYGSQKGATPDMIKHLDRGMALFADVLKQQLEVDVLEIPGSGAAGGLGAGLIAFTGASLQPGIDTVIEATGLTHKLTGVHLVITGEGRTDSQTAFGKVPVGIAKVACQHNIPVICLSGGLGKGIDELFTHGITALFSILNSPMSLEEAMLRTEELLTQAAENVARLYFSGGR